MCHTCLTSISLPCRNKTRMADPGSERKEEKEAKKGKTEPSQKDEDGKKADRERLQGRQQSAVYKCRQAAGESSAPPDMQRDGRRTDTGVVGMGGGGGGKEGTEGGGGGREGGVGREG